MAAAPSISYFQINLLSKADTAGFKMCYETHQGANFGKCCMRAAAVEILWKVAGQQYPNRSQRNGRGVLILTLAVNMRLSLRSICRLRSFGIWCRVVWWIDTDVGGNYCLRLQGIIASHAGKGCQWYVVGRQKMEQWANWWETLALKLYV